MLIYILCLSFFGEIQEKKDAVLTSFQHSKETEGKTKLRSHGQFESIVCSLNLLSTAVVPKVFSQRPLK